MKKIIIILALLLLGSWVFYGVQIMSKQKTGWVDLTKVFKEFEFKKELEKRSTNAQSARQAKIDSLELELKILANNLDSKKKVDASEKEFFYKKRDAFLLKKQQYEQDNASMTQEYDSQIMKQLNQYVKDYGKKQGYDYIFGAEGSGSLMYADEGEDVTEELIVFMNKRYRGISE